VTGWPKGTRGVDASVERLGQSITAVSDGRLKVTVYRADTLVRAFEVFDAGVADVYHTDEVYFADKSPALNFFCAVPYGLTASEVCSWIDFGGGQALWDEVDAQFNIKPLMAFNAGVQIGGWFTKQVNTPGDFKGLGYRMPELGAEVLRRMGATVVTTPVGEILDALKPGAIDASEWVGPWMDMDLGLHKAADYYYYPGFHEPGTNLALGIDKTVWDGMTASERSLIEAAAQAEVTRSLAECNAENVKSLKLPRADNRIKILRFNDELIKVFGKLSKEARRHRREGSADPQGLRQLHVISRRCDGLGRAVGDRLPRHTAPRARMMSWTNCVIASAAKQSRVNGAVALGTASSPSGVLAAGSSQ
jgi:TRAP-type mannitol/chloroaromatic compound transport system substrate-binding protein